jgi:hypothetical protein
MLISLTMRIANRIPVRSLFSMRSLTAAVVGLFALGLPAMGQQDYVGRYDLFVGYTYLDSPKISLSEPGIHIQVGLRTKSWMSMGFDYSRAKGDGLITPDLLPTALQTTLGAQLAGLAAAGRLPAGYTLKVPLESQTQTFAAGPQIAYHGIKWVTPFVRPSMGAIREVAIPKPGDAIATAIVQGLAPTGRKRDWQGFYGVGGGFDFNATKHIALRVQADFVYDHLFNDILRDGRHTIRFSIGPALQWGRNMK